jgi:hypothetical protein
MRIDRQHLIAYLLWFLAGIALLWLVWISQSGRLTSINGLIIGAAAVSLSVLGLLQLS